MNVTTTQSDPNDREELARLLPGSVERDLPSDRHHQLQEFLMSEIHRDLRVSGQRQGVRRLAFLTSALTAVVTAAAVALVIGMGGTGGRSVPGDPTTRSGQEILLAAADTAAQQPEATGTYWYVKVVVTNPTRTQTLQWETWTQRDGQTWFRSAKTGDRVVRWTNDPYVLGAMRVSFEQLQTLPAGPDALKAWLTANMRNSDETRKVKGELSPAQKEAFVFRALLSLVSELPAPPKVRAAAFQAIAAYPGVTSLGPVDGGQGLQIAFDSGPPARLVVDPATSRIRETSFLVMADGASYTTAEGGVISLDAEWTNSLPG